MTENLVIFSEDGNIIGSKTRQDVHMDPLRYWHGVTQIWVFNKDKQLLCTKRSSIVESNPDKWQTYVGGHVQNGDDFEGSAVKEINEEIGLVINRERLILIGESKYIPAKHISKAYLVIFNSDTDNIVLNDGEISEVRWMSLGEYDLLFEQNPNNWCNTLNKKNQEKIMNLLKMERRW